MAQQSVNHESELPVVKLAILCLVLLGLVGGITWLFITRSSTGTLRLWALISTFAVPVFFFVGYRLGSRRVAETEAEARGMVQGIETGVRHVMTAAHQTADLRVNTVREVTRIEQPPQASYTVLPAAESVIAARPRLEHGGEPLYLE